MPSLLMQWHRFATNLRLHLSVLGEVRFAIRVMSIFYKVSSNAPIFR